MARQVTLVVFACGPVFTRAELFAAKVDWLLAVGSNKARLANARVAINCIDTRSIVVTLVFIAVIFVGLAAITLKPHGTMAAEAALFQDLAGAVILAGAAVAGVHGVLAVASMEARRAVALIVPQGHRAAAGTVLARKGVAGVALGQDVRLRFVHTHKVVGGGRENQLVLHGARLRAACDAGLNVVLLDPVREPAQGTVAVERVGAQRYVGDGLQVSKGALRDQGHVISMQGQYSQGLEANETVTLNTLQLVIAQN
uniref:Uncharacterized protein n=1 Tax=Ixodes ricinus TaxID=34613 RepID=A0A6B0V7H4_IXORI